MTAGAAAIASTAGGSLLPLATLLPALGVLMSLLLGGRRAEWIALGLMPVEFAVAVAIACLVWRSGQPLVYPLGGYTPPLGIALRADGFSAVMLVTAGLIAPAAALYARTNFAMPQELAEKRAPLVFWTLLQGIQAALNLVFLGGDLFNLYVGLELLTFAAVPLVSIDGRPETVTAALRYLLFALFGSVFYLLGVALLYGAYGTLDIALLAPLVRPEPAVWLAAGLMTAGLLAKTALFPLHLWLPPAHANAPAAASAVLSGLVVKGSFFLVVRLWFDVLAALPGVIPGTILAALGSAAILSGSVLALRQARLKLLIAYSTVAQIGYLFLMFPLVAGPWAADAFSGGIMQALSHAFAKAAMFLSAGLIAESLGHDRIAELGGAARALPVTFLALGLGGLSLMGLPPSGGFAAKWLLMKASIEAGQWVWAVVMAGGGLLAGGYLYRVLARAFSGESPQLKAAPARSRESVALALALVALLLAFAPQSFFAFLQIGRPAAGLALQ
jgi:multicomponent Na+:H+ antiporter subunit D